jgi:VIT1/CCC1 family predicted Fe2+/Mn2+ transporter
MRPKDHSHEPEDIAGRLANGIRPSYLRDWVNGGIDGTVTTFAVVAGVAGADLSARIVLILGAANLLADGFSMAASNYSATRTELQEMSRLRRMEERHIDLYPEGEREEVRQILFAKGFREEELERAVAITTATRETWINTMLSDEHGQPSFVRSPMWAGFFTFVAFGICGFIPLLPYIAGFGDSLYLSAVLSGTVFFAIGSLKSGWVGVHWFRAGAETFLIGALAASLAYLAGSVLKSLG